MLLFNYIYSKIRPRFPLMFFFKVVATIDHHGKIFKKVLPNVEKDNKVQPLC